MKFNKYIVEAKQSFTSDEAKEIGDQLGIDWKKWDVEQFRMGMDVELEHGTKDPDTNVTDDDSLMTGKIALAHLNEIPDYYTRLKEMEDEAKKTNESSIYQKYPELDRIAKEVGKIVETEINKRVRNVSSDMPYKAQYTLEQLIKILERSV